ncbi:hypothetical protein Ddc_11873 [Ditylenchus destructor]|nr:hypothetical protein Ddc_11873 [Ditylenchus destructor]
MNPLLLLLSVFVISECGVLNSSLPTEPQPLDDGCAIDRNLLRLLEKTFPIRVRLGKGEFRIETTDYNGDFLFKKLQRLVNISGSSDGDDKVKHLETICIRGSMQMRGDDDTNPKSLKMIERTDSLDDIYDQWLINRPAAVALSIC